MKILKCFIACLAVAATLAGCVDTGEDEQVSEKPTVAFEGEKDPRFVGSWKVEKGQSSYVFQDSGDYRYQGVATAMGNTMKIDSKGQWLATPERFLVKDEAGNVTQYAYKFQDGKLTLSLTGTMKQDTVLVKQ
ncbi:MAG TPA: hypothetical protein VGE01_08065 [Fimbriimonas sp.]